MPDRACDPALNEIAATEIPRHRRAERTDITTAAAKLYTTQPAVSKQLRQLEDELGFKIFVRHGRALSKVTPPGERVIECAVRVLREVHNIKGISTDFKDDSSGTLSIGTTHTQARYVLPPVVKAFRERYPKVQLNLLQGTSEQIAEMARTGRIDLAIATGSSVGFDKFALLPCYRWHRQVIVPRGHPLADVDHLTLEQLGEHPIVTYAFSFTGPSSLTDAFLAHNLHPNIALAARDADVIKTYVRLGIGVGIIANMAIDPVEDADLVVIEPVISFRPTPAGSVSIVPRCCASTCTTSSACWRRISRDGWWIAHARPRARPTPTHCSKKWICPSASSQLRPAALGRWRQRHVEVHVEQCAGAVALMAGLSAQRAQPRSSRLPSPPPAARDWPRLRSRCRQS